MKRNICAIITILLFGGCLFGQYKNITVPAGTKVIDNFPPSVRYFYPQFVQGQFVLNNNQISTVMINYNMLSDAIEFLQGNDTLILIRKGDLKYVIAESDTFVYMSGYMKPIYNQKLKVYCKDRFYLKEILKRGAMGTVNRSAGIGSFSDFEQEGVRYDIIVPDDMVYRREVSYHITTPRGTLEPFKKANILMLFRYHRANINRYIKDNKISFEKQEDIIKLAEYLSTL